MKISFPSSSTYVSGVLLAAAIAGLFLVLTPTLGLDLLATPWVFALGLFIGHLVGAIVRDSAKGTAGQTRRPRTAPAPAGEQGHVTLYVGNLAFRASKQELQTMFARYGTVHSARIMTDRVTRKPRGFGFVEMDAKDAAKAVAALNGTDFGGRTLKVNEASERNGAE